MSQDLQSDGRALKGWRAARQEIRRIVGTMRPNLRTQRKVALGGLAALMLEVAMRLLEPWPVKIIIDAVLPAAVPGGVVRPGIGTVILLAAITAGLPLIGNVVTFVGMTAVMLVLDPLLAVLAVLAVVPLFFLSSGRASTKITAASREQRSREGEVLAALGRLVAGRTTIVITHDPALVATCDRVVEIVGGTTASAVYAHKPARSASIAHDPVT